MCERRSAACYAFVRDGNRESWRCESVKHVGLSRESARKPDHIFRKSSDALPFFRRIAIPIQRN
jgi:hypothetical protein